MKSFFLLIFLQYFLMHSTRLLQINLANQDPNSSNQS